MTRSTVVLLAAALVACGGGGDAGLSEHGFTGTELPAPLPKPNLDFIDSRGQPYNLATATAGRVTLVLSGYTHCPDQCPVHLSNLAAVLDKLPDDVQSAITVVFVTTDPARDTPAVLDRWVKQFDPRFVALTGSDSVLRAAQQALGLPRAQRTPVARDSLALSHASQLIAFTRDGMGRVEYPFGTRQRDWAHDLPLLVAFRER